MQQDERRLFLIRSLQSEGGLLSRASVPQNEAGQRDLLRGLMNVRPPDPVPQDVLAVQDAYLQEECRRRGVQRFEDIPAAAGSRMRLWQGDITTLACDAIVNAANPALLGCFHPCHSCIDNCIHSWAGMQLRLACEEIMRRQGHEEPAGQARITPAFNLPCRYVLHTVGPIVGGGRPVERDREQLASCYRSCLDLAAANGLRQTAFCCISTGVFGYPAAAAAETAVAAVSAWLDTHPDMEVVFNVFTDRDRDIYTRLLA